MFKCALYLRECNRLGASNFIPSNLRLQIFVEEAKLLQYVEKEVATPIDLMKLTTHTKKEVKENRITLDSTYNHFIPHIA